MCQPSTTAASAARERDRTDSKPGKSSGAGDDERELIPRQAKRAAGRVVVRVGATTTAARRDRVIDLIPNRLALRLRVGAGVCRVRAFEDEAARQDFLADVVGRARIPCRGFEPQLAAGGNDGGLVREQRRHAPDSELLRLRACGDIADYDVISGLDMGLVHDLGQVVEQAGRDCPYRHPRWKDDKALYCAARLSGEKP